MRLLPLLLFCLPFAGTLQAIAQEQIGTGYRSFAVQNREAKQIADQLRNVIPDARIIVDGHVNRILIQGNQDAVRAAGELIQSLDQPVRQPRAGRGPIAKPEIRAYKLSPADFKAVSDVVRRRYSNVPQVRITADSHTNQLIVAAPPQIHSEVSQLVRQKIDQASGVSTNQQAAAGQSLKLRSITWRDLERKLEEIWGRQLTISTHQNGELATIKIDSVQGPIGSVNINRATQQVAINARPRVKQALASVITVLDTPTNNKTKHHVVALKRADPNKIRKAIALVESLKDKSDGPGRASRVIHRQQPRPHWGGDLVASIFRQKNDDQKNDDAEAKGAQKQNKDPGKLPSPEEDGGLIGPVQIEIIEELDVIVVRGHPRDVERVTKIIQQIQAQSQETQPDVRIYQLRDINSQSIADLVSRLYQEVYAPRQGSVSITALVKPNALLLIGRPENIKSVVSLIQELDQPVEPRTQFEVFPLKYMSVLDAERQIEELFQGQAQTSQQPGQVTQQAGLATRVNVVADYRSNTLIVQASPRDLEEVAQLIKKIDVIKNTKGARNEVKIFKLTNTLAEDLAPVLQDALNGQLQGAGTGRTATGPAGIGQQGVGQGALGQQQQIANVRSAMLSLMTVDTKTGRMLNSGIMFDVRVTADTNSNSLVVTGPAENMELIGVLVQQLDQLPAADAQIKVFTVINGDATTLFNMFTQLFGQQVGQGGTGQAGGIAQLPLQTGASDSSLVPLRFAVDIRTNSIIASGSEGDLNVVEALLTRLDLNDLESRTTKVYRLRNAPALDVADALNVFLDGRQTINELDPNVISPFEQIERAVIVVPELVSNSLIVSATPKYFEELEDIIDQLDRRPPMVMIQVLIAEVDLDDAEEFGVEIGLQDSMLFDRGVGVIGFPFNQSGLGNNSDALALATREGLAGQALSNLAVGRTNMDLGYGGLVLSAGNESINVLLRALHDRRRLQILSRPQIMTLDNLAAFIQVGARVPRITSVNQAANTGAISNSIVLENVGILLGVTPRVSPDGLIVMEINAEKSEVGPEEQGIPIFIDAGGNLIRSPQIEITTAQTTISAHSGQTVVFAGLITKSNTFIRRGVPHISDLPIIGPAFRFDAEVSRRTELLIIMTPYIMFGDENVEWMNQREAERMSWCLADVIDVHGAEGVPGMGTQFMQQGAPRVIYPDMDPTATEPAIAPETLPPAQLENPSDSKSSRRQRSNPTPSSGVVVPASLKGDRTANRGFFSWLKRGKPNPSLDTSPRISRLPNVN